MNQKSLESKKIVMVIAPQDFRDEEYFIPRSIFRAEGAEIKTASSKKGKAVGTYGGEVNVDLSLDEINILDFDGIVFVGGSGASKYMNDEKCHEVAREFLNEEKIIGAICIAPTILARAGILKEKKATVWQSTLDKSAVKVLKEEGAEFKDEKVVTDGNIITASGPKAARSFGETVVRALTED